MNLWPLSALLLLAAIARADTYPRQPFLDAQHYIFRITLTDENDEITGETTADLRFLKDGVREFALDLANTMTVTAVSSGSETHHYAHAADRLAITLATPPHAGERCLFTIRYHGVPASGLHIAKNRYGERTFFGVNWPNLAHQWLPTIDHPSDKATSEFLVTAPAKYQVVANGLLQEVTDLGDGRRLTHWKQSVPIATWLNVIGVAQFASRYFGPAAGIPLETWVFHQDRDAGIPTFEMPMRRAIEFYSAHIGTFPYEKLAGVEALGFNGGMENASAIFYGERAVTGKPALSLVAHEIAHQWFGDSVTEKDWDDVWLSEGFATYFALLTTEHYEGRDAFAAGLKRSRETVFATEQRLPGIAVIHNNLSDMKQVLNQLVYQKGGWTLHMLRGEIGTDNFWTGIREYYRRYRDSNASTDDFRHVMEETSGQDLGWFFQQWLKRAGSPALEGTWRYNSGKVEISLTQTQPGDPYRLPLEFAIDGRIERAEMTRKQQSFSFATEKAPGEVTLDPNTSVLMNAKFSK